MRVNKLILFVLTFLLTFNSNASELVLEPQAMLYYRVPLGGGHKEQLKSTFGFRLDRTLVEKGKPVDYQKLFRQPAVLDFRMDHAGIESLTIAGVDYLKQYRMSRAAEDEAAAVEDGAETDAEAPAAEDGAVPVEEGAEAVAEAPATEESAAPAEEVAAEEAPAEEIPDEEEPGFFENLPEVFEDSQNFGLIIGVVLAAGFVLGVGD